MGPTKTLQCIFLLPTQCFRKYSAVFFCCSAVFFEKPLLRVFFSLLMGFFDENVAVQFFFVALQFLVAGPFCCTATFGAGVRSSGPLCSRGLSTPAADHSLQRSVNPCSGPVAAGVCQSLHRPFETGVCNPPAVGLWMQGSTKPCSGAFATGVWRPL